MGKIENDLYQKRTNKKAYNCVDCDRKIFRIFQKLLAIVFVHVSILLYKKKRLIKASFYFYL